MSPRKNEPSKSPSEPPVLTVDGGLVDCIEGVRLWMRDENGNELLPLIFPSPVWFFGHEP